MKTIKRERQVRLDELISWAWNNDVTGKRFRSDKCNEVYFDRDKWITFDCACVTPDERFTITEEVEIDENTELDLIAVTKDKECYAYVKNSINEILEEDNELFEKYQTKFIYLQNDDGSIDELIWTKERGLVD